MNSSKFSPVIISELMDFTYYNIINFFSSIDINLPQTFLSLTRDDILRLIIRYLPEIHKNLPGNKINLSNYQGLIKKLKNNIPFEMTYQSRMIIFDSIKRYEPPEVISEFLKTSNNFRMLLFFCYRDFIVKITKKNTRSFQI